MEITKDYFLKNLKSALIPSSVKGDVRVAIFNQYKVDLGAVEAETLIDITDKGDFKLVVDCYGIQTAVDCYADGNSAYFLVGANYKQPKNIKNIDYFFNGVWDDIAEMIMTYPENYAKYISFPLLTKELYNCLVAY